MKAFDIELAEDKLVFSNFAVFGFESICVKGSTITDTKTTARVVKQEPISVSITSNLLKEPLCICDTEPQSLLSSFVTSLKNFAEKIKLELGLKFLKIGTTIQEKLERVTLTLNKRKPTISPTSENDQDSAVHTEDE